MRHHRGVAGAGRKLGGIQRLAERADLVDLDEDAVGDAGGDASCEPFDIGHEQVVADELHPLGRAGLESCDQPSQSSSAMPSSTEQIG